MLKSLSVPHNGTIKPKMFSDIYIYKTDQKQDGTGLVLLQQQNQTGSVNKPVWYTSAEPNQFLPDPALKLSTNLYDILQQNRATSVLILFASCQQTCITYIIAVWTVKNSWWWTEELYEICRILFQKEIWETSTSGWFYCKNLSRCAVPWMSNYLLHFPHIVAIIIKSPALPWGIFFLQVTSAHPLVPCIKNSPWYIDMIENGVLIDSFCSRIFPLLQRSCRFSGGWSPGFYRVGLRSVPV